MTEQVRYRVEKQLIKEAERVCREIGLAPSQAVSLFFAQLVKVGGLPFRPSNFPALGEYGATLAEADAAEAQALKEIKSERKAGRVFKFTDEVRLWLKGRRGE
jgi:addiction module RelB/DinJ family antitoxin